MKTPACHTPAAKTRGAADPSAEESAWKTKKAKQEPVGDPPGKVLVQGRLVSASCTDLRGFPCGRYGSLSSRAQRGRGGDPRAAGSKEVEFEVKTAQVQSTVWKRYLVQLGTAPVMYMCSAARGDSVEADTVLAVVDFSKKCCHPDAWTSWPMRLAISVLLVDAMSSMADVAAPAALGNQTKIVEEHTRSRLASTPRQQPSSNTFSVSKKKKLSK